MSAITEAIELARSGRAETASDLLKGEFEKLQTPERMVELCEYIAVCFENLDDYLQAGNWYEAAGDLIMSDMSSLFTLRAIRAVDEYEKALNCYSRGDDEEYATRCTEVIRELRRSYSCS